MARRGRPKKSKDQKLRDALDRTAPAEHILERRRLFSFVQPPANKRQDGRNGEIDSEVCDAIGQMCALGLLDGHGYDPVELRDKGRFWGGHCARLHKARGPKTGSFERRDRSEPTGALNGDDLLFDRMDDSLWLAFTHVGGQVTYSQTYERKVLWSLLVAPLIGYEEVVPWAQGLIAEALRERGRPVKGYATCVDRGYLTAAIRGLCILTEGSLPGRYERRAA